MSKQSNSLWATAHGFPRRVSKVPLSCLWLLGRYSIITTIVLFGNLMLCGIQGTVLPDMLWQTGCWRRAKLHWGWVITTCCCRKWWRWTRWPVAHNNGLWTRWTWGSYNSSWWRWKPSRLHYCCCRACWRNSTLANCWSWRWCWIIHVRNQYITRGISHFHTSHHNFNSRRKKNLFTPNFAAWELGVNGIKLLPFVELTLCLDIHRLIGLTRERSRQSIRC